jgi:hypothetical protein
MSEVKDNLLQLDKVVGDLNKRLDENIDKIDKLSVVYNKFSKASATAPSQYVNVLNDTKKAVDDLTKSSVELTKEEQKLLKNKREVNATLRSEIATRKAQTAEIEKTEKALARENAKLEASSNLYNKVQAKMNALSNEYKNLATRKELGISLTDKEAKRYEFLQGKIQTYDKTLKAVDGTMGKYSRNVGNYASGFNPLNNSINQLSREMPAFANSVQTGFMAISNNLPIFFDAIGNIRKENAALRADMQPTKSVFSQLASSIFSIGTALSVGVTLLTVYGKDIVEFFTNTSKAQESYKKNTQELNATYTEQAATLQVVKEVVNSSTTSQEQLNNALKLAQQEGVSLNAVEEARKGNLKLLNAELDNNINLSIKKAKADKLIQLIAQQELDNAKTMSEYAKSSTGFLKSGLRGSGIIGQTILSFITEKEIKNIKDSEDAIEGYKKQLKDLGLETLLDTEKTKKGTKDKIDLNFKEIQSIYELKKAKLESQKVDIQTNLDNENITFENKIKLRQDLSKKLIELANLDAKYEKDVSQQKYLDDIQQNALALQNKEISSNQYYKNINDISKRYSNEQEKISVSVSDKLKEIYNNDLKYYGDIQEKELEKKRKTEAEKKEFTEKYNELILNSEIEKYKKISETEGNTLEVRQQAFRKYRLLALEELDFKKRQEMANAILANKTDEEIKFIIAKYDELIKKLQETKTPLEKFQEDAEKANKAFIKGFQSDFMNEAGFSKLQYLIENFNTLKESGIASALAISEAFQEAFNTIANASQQNFDAEYSRLEQEKNYKMQFAGESTAEKEGIEKEYERRKKEIQRREAEAQKRLAVFNIRINTAQAILAVFAKTPFPAGIPLAALTAAIGAAQIAMVSAQQIPQFWKGTDNAPEGLAWTQEKGAEVITDSKGNVKTYGNNKGAQLTYLNKGDKVYKSHTDYINKELSKNGIQPMGQSFSNVNVTNGLTAEDLNAGIESLKRAISSKENINIQIDKSGFKTAINGKQYLNNRLILKGRSV